MDIGQIVSFLSNNNIDMHIMFASRKLFSTLITTKRAVFIVFGFYWIFEYFTRFLLFLQLPIGPFMAVHGYHT